MGQLDARADLWHFAGMHNRQDWTDAEFSDEDEQRLERDIRACAAHLVDLKRVYGEPAEMIQPVSFGRFGPRPGPARFPGREVLATLALRD